MGLLSQAFSILSNPPGSITFHLFLVATLAGALQAAFQHWRASAFPQARRTLVGLLLLLVPQLLLFVISGLGLRGILNPAIFLPPLDRAMTMISLVWLVWLWAFPEPSRIADSATALLTLLVSAALALSLLTWAQAPGGLPYNTTTQEFLWQVASIGLTAFGGFIIFLRKPNGWNNGVSVLMLAFFGHTLHLALGRLDGNYPGVVRLAYMAIYPFLFTLPQRFPLPVVPQQPAPKAPPAEAQTADRKTFGTDPKTFHALLDLAAQTNAEKVSHAITRGVAQTLLADLCFLMYLTDNKKQLVIASGYDLIREENLEGTSLGKNAVPMLTNAIQRGRPLRLPASSTSADIRGLGELLGLKNPGHVMSVPIVTPEKDPLGGILVLSPYSDRAWRAEDQAYLKNISNALVPILRRSQRVSTLEGKYQEAERALASANARCGDLQAQLARLQDQLAGYEGTAGSSSQADLERLQEVEAQLASVQALYQESQEQAARSQAESEALRAEHNQRGASGRSEKNKLRAALEEIAQLRNDLQQAERKQQAAPVQEKTTPEPEKPADQHEVIVSISQELRQPLSSIVGYTDLLLGESVGILGTLQRKFVERIKSSTARIGSLIDDLIQVTSMDAGPMKLTLEPVDLNTIIDSAMSYTSSQIREKNITLHLDLPKEIQPIHADREALQQILIHLLQNAGAASPSEGTISLKVQTRSEKDQQYMLMQVSDTGGGIPPEDLPRVFTRLYRANNVLIQGVGDTGVGLSIAKTLTEAQKGRIWVESEAGVGATFSVLLPVAKGS